MTDTDLATPVVLWIGERRMGKSGADMDDFLTNHNPNGMWYLCMKEFDKKGLVLIDLYLQKYEIRVRWIL